MQDALELAQELVQQEWHCTYEIKNTTMLFCSVDIVVTIVAQARLI